jgi:hypothetical protein
MNPTDIEFWTMVSIWWTAEEACKLDREFEDGLRMHNEMDKARDRYFHMTPAEVARAKWQNENEEQN